MTKITFSAQPRKLKGKKVKKIKLDGFIPANLNGDRDKPQMLQVKKPDFLRLYEEVGDTGLFYLKLGEKEKVPVLIDEVQFDSVSDEVIHVTFRQVDLKEKVTAEVPIELVGENDVPNSVVVTVHDAIEVEALPADLPEKFVLDVSKLTEIGQFFSYKDLEYDQNKVRLLIEEEERENPLVLLQEQVREEEVAEESEEQGGEEAEDKQPEKEQAGEKEERRDE